MSPSTWGPVLALVALALLAIASARGDRQASGALVVLGALLFVVLAGAALVAVQLAGVGVDVFSGGVP